MTIANPVGAKVDGNTLSGVETTAIGVGLAKALDGVGGGAYTISAPLSLTGSSFHAGNSSNVADVATVTVAYTTNDYRVPDLSQNLAITLKSTTPTPPTDAKITIIRTQTDPDFVVTVLREDATLLATLPVVTGAARTCSWVEFTFNGTAWKPRHWGAVGAGLEININEV